MNQTKSPLRRCLDRKSRVNREVHARFCERLGVKFPRATRLIREDYGVMAFNAASTRSWGPWDVK